MLQRTFARSLVTVRTWPFVIDLSVGLCALAIFLALVHMATYWLGSGRSSLSHFAECAFAARLRPVLRDAHRHCVRAQLDLCRRLRLYRGSQYARRGMDDCGTRHFAIDSGAQLSCRRYCWR